MLTRSTTTSTIERTGARRRQRRRAAAAVRPFCSTNGCASFLDVDEATGRASCPICGFSRRVS